MAEPALPTPTETMQQAKPAAARVAAAAKSQARNERIGCIGKDG